MIKALFFDIDDTLIKYGKYYVEKSAVEAINKAKEKGIVVIVATGRGYSFLHQDIKDSVKPDYYITVNGTCISDSQGNCLINTPIDEDKLNKLMEICLQRDYPFGIKFPNDFMIYHRYDDFVSQYCNKAISKDNLHDNTLTKDYHKTHAPLDFFMYSANKEAMKLKEVFPDLNFCEGYGDGCECWSNQANKGKAIHQICQMLNITLDQCMAFGDAGNDVEMLKMCGIGVCMGNGKDMAKQAADYITSDIEADGVYNALKHFKII
ncbi:MAG: HAD family hydrolase [Erysipelotrichaceae bacterium]